MPLCVCAEMRAPRVQGQPALSGASCWELSSTLQPPEIALHPPNAPGWLLPWCVVREGSWVGSRVGLPQPWQPQSLGSAHACSVPHSCCHTIAPDVHWVHVHWPTLEAILGHTLGTLGSLLGHTLGPEDGVEHYLTEVVVLLLYAGLRCSCPTSRPTC